MKKVFNLKLVKKVSGEGLENIGVHYTWANVINGQELYGMRVNETTTAILFKRRKSITQLDVPCDFAREHFEVVGNGVRNDEGLEISKFVNQEETYN